MTLTIRPEPSVDFATTARLAADGFGVPGLTFDPAKLRWLYNEAFSEPATVLAMFSGDEKVGQVALVHQQVQIAGGLERAVALVDLFILKAHRSREAIGGLYGEVERFCRQSGIRFILGVPNPSGARVNIRYLKLAPFLKLDIRAGVAVPFRSGRVTSHALADLTERDAIDLFAAYTPLAGDGLYWTGERLSNRLRGGASTYGVHATRDLLLVSSPRTTRRLSHTLLCCLLPRPGTRVSGRDVRAVTAAACAMHRRPLFVYAGVNTTVPLPGLPLPERLRPSPMVVQIRDFQAPETAATFDRFELIDFDFA